MRTKLNRGTALTLAVIAAAAFGSLGAGRALAADTGALNESAAVASSYTPVGDFTDLVKKVTPAVVSIDVHLMLDQTSDDQDGGDSYGMPQIPGFPPGFPFGGMPGMGQAPQAVEAKGSGFIIDPSGIIVTNNHVVKDAKTVSVTLSDGVSYPAKIIGTDPKTDLAVLRINAGHPLPFVQLGNSADVEPGEWVVALGNPFGLGGTVTAGIVSALGRDIGDGPYDKFIQIDAPINEGNSGGPLFDQRGNVIGINTAILSPSGGSVGIGFAIPSDMVKQVVAQLIATGKVVRGYLGVEAEQISPPTAQALGLPAGDPTKDGALVASVAKGSPAARAGLKPMDVITNVNGATVTNPQDLASDIAQVKPGEDATIGLLRDGKTQSLTVAVAALPSNPDADFQQGSNAGPAGTSNDVRLGLTLAPLTQDVRGQLNLPGDVSGAVIADVKPNSPADQVGLQTGDVVIGVGSKSVSSPDDAVADIDAAHKSGASAVLLRVLRQGQPIIVGIGLSGGQG